MASAGGGGGGGGNELKGNQERGEREGEQNHVIRMFSALRNTH